MDPHRGPVPDQLRSAGRRGALLETSEELIPARELGWIVRAMGERGLLAAVDAVMVARPPWIVPYGGFLTVDGVRRRIIADYR